MFLAAYRTRYGVLAGLALFLATLLFLSSFLWSVEITGVETEAEREHVLAVLKDHGFYVGAFLGDQDYTALKYAAMRDLDEYGYLTVNVYGTKACVEISKKVEKPRVITRFDPCNVVASQDGVIVSVRAYNGVTAVKKGDAVKAGQLLVGGVYDSKVLGFRVVHASAVILARTRETFSAYVAYEDVATVHTGRKTSYPYVEVLGYRLPLAFATESPYGAYTVFETGTEARLFERYLLPIVYGTVTYRETERLPTRFTKEAAVKEAKARLDERARVALSGVTVEDCEVLVEEQEDGVTVTYVYTVIKDIAKEQEIYTEEIVWRTFLP